jgi:hypothetical protein
MKEPTLMPGESNLLKSYLVSSLDLRIMEEDIKSALDLKALPMEARSIITGVLKKIQSLQG